MPTISVIVPVYKVEPYIHRCVDSILGQSYPDFELILVDDGSPDNCGAICDVYARTDSRVHVIHQENGGLSAARNAGIDWAFANSESQWLLFVDSDDWIHRQTLELLLREAQRHDAKISIGGYKELREGKLELPAEIPVSIIWEPDRLFQDRQMLATVAWGKLYAKHLFQNVRYPVGRIHEDEYVTHRLLFECGRIAVLELPLYAYYINAVGITKREWRPQRLDIWPAIEAQMHFFEERGEQKLYKVCLRRFLENAKMQCRQLEALDDVSRFSKEKKQIDHQLKKLIFSNWKYGQIHFWDDYEFLRRYYPIPTQVYRMYNGIRKRLGLKHSE